EGDRKRSPEPAIGDVCFSADGRSLVYCDDRETATVVAARTGAVLGTVRLSGPGREGWSATLSPDGTEGALLDTKGEICRFRVGESTVHPTGVKGAWPVRFSSDGRFLACWSADRNDPVPFISLRLIEVGGTHPARDLGKFEKDRGLLLRATEDGG